jgi:hypothetical protein
MEPDPPDPASNAAATNPPVPAMNARADVRTLFGDSMARTLQTMLDGYKRQDSPQLQAQKFNQVLKTGEEERTLYAKKLEQKFPDVLRRIDEQTKEFVIRDVEKLRALMESRRLVHTVQAPVKRQRPAEAGEDKRFREERRAKITFDNAMKRAQLAYERAMGRANPEQPVSKRPKQIDPGEAAAQVVVEKPKGTAPTKKDTEAASALLSLEQDPVHSVSVQEALRITDDVNLLKSLKLLPVQLGSGSPQSPGLLGGPL